MELRSSLKLHSPSEPSSFSPYRILVIDKERGYVRLAELAFQRLNSDFQVTGGTDFQLIIDYRKQTEGTDEQVPRLLLLDPSLPGKEPKELITETRKYPWLRDLKIILFTTEVDQLHHLLGKIGADGILEKTYGFNPLVEALERLLTELSA